MNEHIKQSIIKRAAVILNKILPPRTPKEKACFYHALSMHMAINQLDPTLRPILQAGSASFQAIPDHMDDGVTPTHYSYVYEGWNTPDPNILPELHCWVAVISYEGDFIVDSTTAYLPSLSESIGLKWQSPSPPKCLWADAKQIPAGWVYKPDPFACGKVYQLAMSMFTTTVKGRPCQN